jgi:photosystem II stability/assembly factor-like uncharacterized protein
MGPAAGDGGGGGGGGWLVGLSGLVLNAPDGNQFVAKQAPVNGDLYSLYCVNGIHGWSVGAGGQLIATTDGGATWAQHATGVASALRAVAFADYSTGIAAGDAGTLIHSTDGGNTWSRVAVPLQSALRAVAISKTGTAWVVGDGGAILRSTDGGATFSRIGAVPAVDYTAVRFADDALHGFVAAADGSLLRSSDGGLTWSLAGKASAPLHGVSVGHDGSRVVAVGDKGVTLRTIDGGAHVAEVASGQSFALAAIGFMDDQPSVGWAVGAHGTILRTADNGATWTSLPSPTVTDLTSVEDF